MRKFPAATPPAANDASAVDRPNSRPDLSLFWTGHSLAVVESWAAALKTGSLFIIAGVPLVSLDLTSGTGIIMCSGAWECEASGFSIGLWSLWSLCIGSRVAFSLASSATVLASGVPLTLGLFLFWSGGWTGTTSTRKSNISESATAVATSSLCSVRRRLESALDQARIVKSRMNSSQALAKSTGASALIILTSSSLLMIFLIRARGRSCCFKFLKSVFLILSSCFCQKLCMLSM
mmetsp:Transcript_32196/g.56524  ORF Transcript_32196/g.56524 Transcript_32196/m.56524 type:complete len:235 (-) Transcript_32196:87-791(-)